MYKALFLCGLVCLAVCDQQAGDDGDDGSYIPDKYERPYAQGVVDNNIYQPQGGYQAQPVQQQQGYYQPQQPQAAYRPAAQYTGDARNAAILSEQRYLSGDGKFGAAYTQEDGVEFKEESDPDGTRRGSYSYVDPSGQRRTVSYVAGKNGFQPVGDHLPVGPAPVPAAPQPVAQQYQPQYQPQQYQQVEPEYQPQPQFRPQPQYAPQPQYQPQPQQYQAQPAGKAAYNGVAPNNGGGYTFSSSF